MSEKKVKAEKKKTQMLKNRRRSKLIVIEDKLNKH